MKLIPRFHTRKSGSASPEPAPPAASHNRRPPRRLRLALAGCLACGLGAFGPGLRIQPAAAATPAQVRESIDRGKAYLYSAMKGGNWESTAPPAPGDSFSKREVWAWGGQTAMSVYALLAAGEKPRDERLAAAIRFLKDADLHGTYALALRSQVWPYLPEGAERRELAQYDAGRLLAAAYSGGPLDGFYGYWADEKGPGPAGWHDLSNSQFAVLGAWACEQAGADVPDSYWRRIDRAWRAAQQRGTSGPGAGGLETGGWGYRAGPDGVGGIKPTMTAAGLATLFITQDYLLRARQHEDPRSAGDCAGGAPDPGLDAGLSYLDRHVRDLLNGNHYGLYGLERIGAASGRKYFQGVDWYKAGADRLLGQQRADGSWTGEFGTLPSTAFALLFLARGRAPVAMNKLEYEILGDGGAAGAGATRAGANGATGAGKDETRRTQWNQRPRDVANFVRWSGRELERPLNWQVVNLQASAEDLHDAPVLFVSGGAALDFSEQEADVLRQFVLEGGLVLGNADCPKPAEAGRPADAFGRSFVALGERLFPGRRFRPLPIDHPIFTDQQYSAGRWKLKPPQLCVLGLSNGVREMMVLLPDQDVSRAWQALPYAARPEAFELGQDVFLYAVDREHLRERGETYVIPRNAWAPRGRPLRVARLMVGDNPDPEPAGWVRLANLMHNSYGIDLDVRPVRLGDGALAKWSADGQAEAASRASPASGMVSALAGGCLAHLTGTTAFHLEPNQRDDLRDFVARGGTLVVDAAGGSRAFADAARKELSPLFGEPAAEVGALLGPEDELFLRPGGRDGAAIKSFGYRTYFRRHGGARGVVAPPPAGATAAGPRPAGALLERPRLRAVVEGDHTLLYFSAEDLTAGLVGEPVDGVLGYDPQTATEIMRNIILSVARAAKPDGARSR